MKINPIKTSIVRPGDKLFDIFDQFISTLTEGSILAVTSKIVSICEGSVLSRQHNEKDLLTAREADYYLPTKNAGFGTTLTIKNNILIPNAGIDESNGGGNYILWPKNPQKSANQIRRYLVKRFRLERVGVIITDSKTTPLRWGTTGIALAYSGFCPLNNYIGKPDLDGREMMATKASLVDGLAAAAVLVMGEGSEQTPMAMMENLPFVKFVSADPNKKELESLNIEAKDDLYGELLNSVSWQTGGKKR
ncbi:MAG: coenzyme F420-0:L-glutamate ligase [Patescibacteria group bacterium]